MKHIKLLYNQNAGDEDHSEKELVSVIEAEGFTCDSASLKEPGWEKFAEGTDLLVIAGGDGTVKKVARELLKRRLLDKVLPMSILPLGTANNLAKTLSLEISQKQALSLWKKEKLQPFDVGRITGLDGPGFFIEGLGMGIFPKLIKKMKKKEKQDELDDDPDEKVKFARKLFGKLAETYPLQHIEIYIDGKDYTGDFLLLEVLNIRSIGPNLFLAPKADVADGLFEVVMVKAEHREALAAYIATNDIKYVEKFERIKGEKISIRYTGNDTHVDDKLIKNKLENEILIENCKGMLQFLVPD